ncbi:fibronectin type III domain-containing protein [Streptomyces sp. NPDC051555]|uniref:fibronectin type III domain-containing protein n=1 Tax=Streptomyces sp. NPDC051555 TaxID=3365657 RepID=UPI00379C6F1B
MSRKPKSRKRVVLTSAAVVLGLGALAVPIAANAGTDTGDQLRTTCGVAEGASKWWASGRMALSNQGTDAAKDWKLEFELSEGLATVNDPGTYELKQTGKKVTVTPKKGQGSVPPQGERVVLVGINPSGKAVPQITGCTVNGGGGDDQDTEAPTAPQNMGSYVIDHQTVHVMWKPSTGFGSKIEKYEVFQDGKLVKTVGGDITMTNIEKLTPDTAYRYTVRAVSAAGKTSAFSKEIPLRTKKAPDPDRPAPTLPKKLEGKANGPHQVDLAWQPGKDGDGSADGVSGYRVYQDGKKVLDVDAGTTKVAAQGLLADKEYAFKVTAVNSSGKESAPTDEIRVRTGKGDGGGGGGGHAPGNLTATASSKQNGGVKEHYLDLAWSVPQGQGTIGTYQVHIDGKSAQTFMWGTGDAVMPIPSGTAKREVAVGAQPGKTFKVKIRAKLGDGTWSGFSEEKTVTTGN